MPTPLLTPGQSPFPASATPSSIPAVATPTAPPPTAPITSSTLAPAAPINITQPQPSTAMAGLAGHIEATTAQNTDAYNADLAAKSDAAKASQDGSLGSLMAAMKNEQGPAALQDAAYASTVDPAQKDLQDINNKILAEKVASEREVEALKANPAGFVGSALNNRIQEIQDASTRRQADLSVIQLAKQGAYDSAKAIADRSVTAQAEKQQNYINALQLNYQNNKDQFTKSEQRSFEAAQKTRQDALDMQTYQEKARYDQMIKQQDPLYKAQLAKAQADATAASLSPTGTVAGTVGSSTIDSTQAGYSSTPVSGGGGLTQAAIDQAAIQYATTGKFPSGMGIGSSGVGGQRKTAIQNRAAELNASGNMTTNAANLKSYSSSLGTQQKYLDTTQRAFNTANDTLDSLQTYMAKNNINPSQFPDFNSFSNYLKSKGIDPGAAGGYNAQITTLRAEYSQVLAKGGVRSVETDKEAAKLIPDGLAPADLAKVAAQIKVDGTNVVNDAEKQVSQIQDHINHILQPADATQTEAPQPLLTPAQIPSGYYQASDGLLYKK